MTFHGDQVTSPLIREAEGAVLDDILHFAADGQFNIVGRRGRVVKIEDKRISLDEIEQRLLALDGIATPPRWRSLAVVVRPLACCWYSVTRRACTETTG